MANWIKDPDAVLDYTFDWSNWLQPGETIAGYTLDVELGIVNDRHNGNATSVTVWLSGGDDGEFYRVTNHIVTSAGREDDRTMNVQVIQR